MQHKAQQTTLRIRQQLDSQPQKTAHSTSNGVPHLPHIQQPPPYHKWVERRLSGHISCPFSECAWLAFKYNILHHKLCCSGSTDIVCKVSMCRKGMQGYKYSWSGFRSHIGQHELRGELEYLSPSLSLLSLPPMSVVLHDGKSENIAAHPKEYDYTGGAEEIQTTWTSKTSSTSSKVHTELAAEELSVEFRREVQDLNDRFKRSRSSQSVLQVTDKCEAIPKGCEVEMTTKGYRCRGPEAVAPHALARLSETPIPCPRNTIIAYDTASISFPLRSKNRSRVVLGARCVPCQSDFNATHTLKSLGIWRDASGPCGISDRFRPSWRKSMFCDSHLCRGWMLRSHALKSSRKVYDISCLAQLTQAFLRQWTYKPTFQKVIDRLAQITKGKIPGSSLVCLDVEWVPTSGLLTEVAFCEYDSGKVLLDVRLKHRLTASKLIQSDLSKAGSMTSLLTKSFSRAYISNVYGSDHQTSNGLIDIHMLAQLLQARGITLETIMLS